MKFLVVLNFAASLQGIFLTYLIAHNKSKELKSIVLGILTLILSISLLGGILGMSGYYKIFPHFINVADPLHLLFGPLLYTYIFVLTHDRLPKYYLLHGLPYLIYWLSFIPFYLQDAEEKIKFAEYIFMNDTVPLKAFIMQLTRVFHMLVYIIVCLIIVIRYQRKIKNNFSFIEKISLDSAKYILYLFLVILVIAIATFLLGYFTHYNFNLSNNIIGFFVGITIYFIAFSTWNKKSMSQEELVDLPSLSNNKSESNYEDSDKTKGRNVFILNDEQLKDYSERLEKAMVDEKVYTENEISLTELSNKLDIQPYQLSELISRISGDSFFDFINKHRIEEIKVRLKDPKYNALSILGVAMDCGFNSKSSFNNAFKKFTGLTPSEYRKEVSTG